MIEPNSCENRCLEFHFQIEFKINSATRQFESNKAPNSILTLVNRNAKSNARLRLSVAKGRRSKGETERWQDGKTDNCPLAVLLPRPLATIAWVE